MVNGRNIWRADLEKALAVLQHAQERLGDRLWVAPSCSLLHSPVDLASEDQLDAELKSWLAFAVQKCEEVSLLARAVNEPEAATVLKRSHTAALSRPAAPPPFAFTNLRFRLGLRRLRPRTANAHRGSRPVSKHNARV